nr:HAD family hydrolase [uncultured Moellerella sp.]
MAEDFKSSDKVLSVFDFDGTLTYHDSFIPFLKFAFGKKYFFSQLIKLVLPTLQCAGRKLTRDQLKAVLVKTYLTGIDESWLKTKANEFCALYWNKLMRPTGLLAVAQERHSGAEVTICSASPELVLEPFANKLGIKLIATQLEVENGVLTGRINGQNCRCGEKVKRLEQRYGDLSQYNLRAWGDTRGDHELLAAAQAPHWRHFHSAWSKRKSPIKE